MWASLSVFSAFCCRLFDHLFNVVVGGFDTRRSMLFGQRSLQIWQAIFIHFLKVHVESRYIVSSDSILHFRQFTRSLADQYHVRTIALAMRMCTQNLTTPTIILNFREENFRDQKSNHEIHENIVQRKFGAIRYPVRTLHNLQIYFLCISIAISYIMTRFHRASDFSQWILMQLAQQMSRAKQSCIHQLCA